MVVEWGGVVVEWGGVEWGGVEWRGVERSEQVSKSHWVSESDRER